MLSHHERELWYAHLNRRHHRHCSNSRIADGILLLKLLIDHAYGASLPHQCLGLVLLSVEYVKVFSGEVCGCLEEERIIHHCGNPNCSQWVIVDHFATFKTDHFAARDPAD